VARLTVVNEERARRLIDLYPHPRSALIPILHILQGQDGYLTDDGMTHVGELVGLEAVEVRGTATFYDMFHTEPIGKYLVGVCTNIACMLQGAYELLAHIEERLGVAPGGTTADGQFTLEETECLALCGNAPCVTLNWRFFGDVHPDRFDQITEDLRAGRLDAEVPPHGVLSRVERSVGLFAAGASVHGAGGPYPPRPASATTSKPPEAGVPADLETHLTTPADLAHDGGRGQEQP
jgi:NADH-quinone oxidoreductase subunit E